MNREYSGRVYLFSMLLAGLFWLQSCGNDLEKAFDCVGESAFTRIEAETTSSERTVNFTLNYTGDFDLQSVSWEFGDGNTGSGTTVAHTYAASGSYSVKAKVRLRDGDTSCEPEPTRNVTVE